MKKNGFTLIEILGVVVILSMIVILAFPTITKNIKKSETKIDSASMELIKSATDLYMDDNKVLYPQKLGDEYCITLQKLVDSGHLRTPIMNVKTNQEIKLNELKECIEIKK